MERGKLSQLSKQTLERGPMSRMSVYVLHLCGLDECIVGRNYILFLLFYLERELNCLIISPTSARTFLLLVLDSTEKDSNFCEVYCCL